MKKAVERESLFLTDVIDFFSFFLILMLFTLFQLGEKWLWLMVNFVIWIYLFFSKDFEIHFGKHVVTLGCLP